MSPLRRWLVALLLGPILLLGGIGGWFLQILTFNRKPKAPVPPWADATAFFGSVTLALITIVLIIGLGLGLLGFRHFRRHWRGMVLALTMLVGGLPLLALSIPIVARELLRQIEPELPYGIYRQLVDKLEYISADEYTFGEDPHHLSPWKNALQPPALEDLRLSSKLARNLLPLPLIVGLGMLVALVGLVFLPFILLLFSISHCACRLRLFLLFTIFRGTFLTCDRRKRRPSSRLFFRRRATPFAFALNRAGSFHPTNELEREWPFPHN